MNTTVQPNDPAPANAPITPIKGFQVLMTVVVVIALFLVICHFAGISEFWVGIVFMMYWAGMLQAKLDQLPGTVVGAVVGLLMSHLLQQLPLWLGPSGELVFLAGMLALIYLQIMAWALIAVNMSTMLFLTVGTIPLIQPRFQFIEALIGLAAGVVYFAGIAWTASLFAKRKAVGH